MGVVLFYTGTIGFTLGVFVHSFIEVGLQEIIFILVLAVVAGMLWRRRSFASSAPKLLGLSVFLFLFAIGAFRFEYASWSETNPLFESQLDTEVELIGTIVREPEERKSSTHLYVEVQDETILVLADPYGQFSYGDEVIVIGLLQRPKSFETELGRTFNYPGYLRARGIAYTVSYADVTVVGSGGNMFLSKIFSFKHAFMSRLELTLPEPQVGLGEGLLLGVKRALGDELEKMFRKTGIIHIVVLSGYNIMLVVAFMTYVLSIVIPTRFQLPFGVLAVAAFALMVGLSATVLRASIMAVIYLVARSQNRIYFALRALVLAGIVMLFINPYLLAYDTGFQLSFLATLGLILLGPHIESLLARVPNFIGLRGILTATLSTQFFVLPFLLYQIGEFSVVAVLVNVLVLPMVPLAMLLTFVVGVVAFMSTEAATFISTFAYASLEYILTIVTWFGSLSFAAYEVPPFPFWVVVLVYVGLAYAMYLLHTRNKQLWKDELIGWIVEEEELVRKRVATEKQSPTQSGSLSVATDTPVFFK